MTVADPHDLTGAYALDALDEDERAGVERHLAHCASCALEVAEFEATAARLGLAATVPVRPGLRAEVLRRIASVRQVAPGTAMDARLRPAVRRRARGPLAWALAASVAVAAAFGGVALWQYERAQDAATRAAVAEGRADAVAGVLAAPDAKSATVRVAGGTGTVVVSAERDRAVFMASGMPAPPDGRVYQLWFDDGGAMRSAGLMDPALRSQTVLMRGPVAGASGVGVTVEPAGGSPRPTSAPVTLLSLPT
ncbi:anti-sigma factor [Streptomyces sp. DSM 110735]|uniref:anti-sigma factor n=1 Tax=Streptomyces sp. DSM 110735 TaxID=2775031 RepID=UPI0018F5D983|nr:anti-sigma factor [Streptomyces sp. DSM 110735]MBJ7907316.1 anti-sigma factor [Streptomyces sp. DSM 110735]